MDAIFAHLEMIAFQIRCWISNNSTITPEIISQVKIYPIPFSGKIVVTLAKNNANSNFELFDIAGKKILTSRLSNVINRIQFNKPAAGIYVYRFTNDIGNVVVSGKLVKR